MSQQLSVWDLDEWRMVVQDLMNAMEAHDIAHFVEAGHPENYQACVAASDALQVAQRRARAMLDLTKGLEGSPGGTLDVTTEVAPARIGAFDYTENVDGTITRKDWRQP